MPYPTIVTVGDECIARATVDGRFSVRWDQVLNHAYEPPTNENRAVIGFCRLLLAARDNFLTCPWDDPLAEAAAQEWDGVVAEIYCTPLVPDRPVFSVHIGLPVARINWDLTWSVRWHLVDEIRGSSHLTENPAIGSLVNLLLAAKDNFLCTPW